MVAGSKCSDQVFVSPHWRVTSLSFLQPCLHRFGNRSQRDLISSFTSLRLVWKRRRWHPEGRRRKHEAAAAVYGVRRAPPPRLAWWNDRGMVMKSKWRCSSSRLFMCVLRAHARKNAPFSQQVFFFPTGVRGDQSINSPNPETFWVARCRAELIRKYLRPGRYSFFLLFSFCSFAIFVHVFVLCSFMFLHCLFILSLIVFIICLSCLVMFHDLPECYLCLFFHYVSSCVFFSVESLHCSVQFLQFVSAFLLSWVVSSS